MVITKEVMCKYSNELQSVKISVIEATAIGDEKPEYILGRIEHCSMANKCGCDVTKCPIYKE